MARFYPNSLQATVESDDRRLFAEFGGRLAQQIADQALAGNLPLNKGVYTGAIGSAYTLHCASSESSIYNEPGRLRKAAKLLFDEVLKHFPEIVDEKAVHRSRRPPTSYMSGTLGVATVIGVTTTDEKLRDKCARLVQETITEVTNSDSEHELFNGHAGAIMALQTCRKMRPLDEARYVYLIELLLRSLLMYGRQYAQKERLKMPLMFTWHDKEYIGAAHGVAGILYTMLRFPTMLSKCDERALTDVKATVDWLLSIQQKNGNWTSSTGHLHKDRGENELVHWCHGAPGVIYTMAAAYEVFSEAKYLESCLRAGECIWQKGLLTKGPGLCHGIAGNAYAFLLLYRITNDELWLRRAHTFARFMCTDADFKKHCLMRPDNPFSLFEGTGGAVLLLQQLAQNPKEARFPFFEAAIDQTQ